MDTRKEVDMERTTISTYMYMYIQCVHIIYTIAIYMYICTTVKTCLATMYMYMCTVHVVLCMYIVCMYMYILHVGCGM